MKEVFEKIYLQNEWKNYLGTNSGPGSAIECSKLYLDFLQTFVENNKIKSILDLGCGDFNLMRHFDFKDIKYFGIDIVSFIIDDNIKTYSNNNIKFAQSNLIDFKLSEQFDLIILKDVLQHLSNANILKILNNIKNAKRIILVNDYIQHNIDSIDGGYRPLNLNNDPFNFNCETIFVFNSCGFIKHVNFISND
jgi:2-polyprenyl-3-methyl-5-hydroxy-6-metoxy-1,4-benzoquinol methylase